MISLSATIIVWSRSASLTMCTINDHQYRVFTALLTVLTAATICARDTDADIVTQPRPGFITHTSVSAWVVWTTCTCESVKLEKLGFLWISPTLCLVEQCCGDMRSSASETRGTVRGDMRSSKFKAYIDWERTVCNVTWAVRSSLRTSSRHTALTKTLNVFFFLTKSIYVSHSLGDNWGTTRPGNEHSPFLSFLCSPHGAAQFQTRPIPDVIFPSFSLSVSTSPSPNSDLEDRLGKSRRSCDMPIPLHFASFYGGQEFFVGSNGFRNPASHLFVGDEVFVRDAKETSETSHIHCLYLSLYFCCKW